MKPNRHHAGTCSKVFKCGTVLTKKYKNHIDVKEFSANLYIDQHVMGISSFWRLLLFEVLQLLDTVSLNRRLKQKERNHLNQYTIGTIIKKYIHNI